MNLLTTEQDVVAVAAALIGSDASLSTAEVQLVRQSGVYASGETVEDVRRAILRGGDPLGEAFVTIRSSKSRRYNGATYTPTPVVESMLSWAMTENTPSRIVDPGAGTGRYLVAAAIRFPKAKLIGVELDPIAALMLRANVVVLGLSPRTTILVEDYRSVCLPKIRGRTLFIGNPPYVRHHDISEKWKDWFAETAAGYGIKASKLAGLHIHFFVKTMQLGKLGDFGAFITSAEWLDVNYGSTLRELLADGLGGCALHVLDPNAMPFTDAMTTGAITCFRVGHRPESLRVRSLEAPEQLDRLTTGKLIPWSDMAKSKRWSTIIRPGPKPSPGYIELGEVCRVHRGQVTGQNEIWIAGPHAEDLPSNVLAPTITKARDLLRAGESLADTSRLRKVINLPIDLDEIDPEHLEAVQRFLEWAKKKGADCSYTAKNRRAWWAVGLSKPAPIVCTYMGRRPPAFVRNLCGARHINIAHGLYPLDNLSNETLNKLTAYLRDNVSLRNGRTYAGGLTKFEPKELERVPVPTLDKLPA